MQSILFRLAVSLATFTLGLVLTTFWLGFSAPTLLTPHGPTPAAAPLAPLAPQGSAVAEAPEAAPCESAANPDGRARAGDPAAKPIIGGVLNGKAVSKPAPAYPAAARAAGLSGTVVVWITVDECGRVETASALSGPQLLREASVEAAHKARFTPTRLAGLPVKVAGTLTYNYLLQ